jgi:hypothetical protein
MTFVNNFLKTLAIPIGDLANWLEAEHHIPASATIDKWNELTGMKVTIDENSTSCEELDNQIVNVNKKPSRLATTCNGNLLDPQLCQHVFIAGHRKGQQCSTKPKGGKDRCSAHKLKIPKTTNIDTSELEPKKSIKSSKSKETIQSDSEDDDFSEPARKVPLPKKKLEKKVPLSSDSEDDDFSEPARKVPLPKKKLEKKVPTTSGSESNSKSDDDDEFSEPARKIPPKKGEKKNITLTMREQ